MEFERLEFADYDEGKIPAMSEKLDTIFRSNPDIDKTAYLNWRMGFGCATKKQFVIMGEAFFTAAFNLIQQCLTDNSDKKADVWIFPILFDIIHGIEVYLKAINASLSIFLNMKHSISEGGHNLTTLCRRAQSLIEEYKIYSYDSTANQMCEGIKVVEKFCENIYEKFADMTFARYPLSKNGQEHFYIKADENEVVDLELLSEQVVYVYHILDFIYNMPEMINEIEFEAMADMMNTF